MSVHDQLRTVGRRHHDQVLALLGDLEQAQADHPDDVYPFDVMRLQITLRKFAEAYGRRGLHGAVDDEPDPPIKAWRPGDDEVDQ